MRRRCPNPRIKRATPDLPDPEEPQGLTEDFSAAGSASDSTPQDAPFLDPQRAAIVAIWPNLSDEMKAGILAVIEAARR